MCFSLMLNKFMKYMDRTQQEKTTETETNPLPPNSKGQTTEAALQTLWSVCNWYFQPLYALQFIVVEFTLLAVSALVFFSTFIPQ